MLFLHLVDPSRCYFTNDLFYPSQAYTQTSFYSVVRFPHLQNEKHGAESAVFFRMIRIIFFLSPSSKSTFPIRPNVIGNNLGLRNMGIDSLF